MFFASVISLAINSKNNSFGKSWNNDRTAGCKTSRNEMSHDNNLTTSIQRPVTKVYLTAPVSVTKLELNAVL